MNKNINSILEGLYGKNSTQYGYVHTDEGINEEDRWITINGTHVQVDDNGTIKNENLKDKIESTSKKAGKKTKPKKGGLGKGLGELLNQAPKGDALDKLIPPKKEKK